jgi:hypothetical protein
VWQEKKRRTSLPELDEPHGGHLLFALFLICNRADGNGSSLETDKRLPGHVNTLGNVLKPRWTGASQTKKGRKKEEYASTAGGNLTLDDRAQYNRAP